MAETRDPSVPSAPSETRQTAGYSQGDSAPAVHTRGAAEGARQRSNDAKFVQSLIDKHMRAQLRRRGQK